MSSNSLTLFSPELWLSLISPTVPTFRFFKTFLATGLGLVLFGLDFFGGGWLTRTLGSGILLRLFLLLFDKGLGRFAGGDTKAPPDFGWKTVLSFSVGEPQERVSSLWMSGTSTTTEGSGLSWGNGDGSGLFEEAEITDEESNGDEGSEPEDKGCWFDTVLALGDNGLLSGRKIHSTLSYKIFKIERGKRVLISGGIIITAEKEKRIENT